MLHSNEAMIDASIQNIETQGVFDSVNDYVADVGQVMTFFRP